MTLFQDNSTMLIEAAKGGHTSVVQLLLDYPHSIMMSSAPHNAAPAAMILPQQQPQISQQQQQQQQQHQMGSVTVSRVEMTPNRVIFDDEN